MPLGVGLEAIARILDRAFLADARQNILQSLAGGRVIEAIADGNQRRSRLLAECREPGEPPRILAVEGKRSAKIDIAWKPDRQ